MSSNFPVRLTRLYGKYYVTVIRRTVGTLDSYKIQPEEIESALASLQAVYRPGSELPGEEVEVTEPKEILARLEFNPTEGLTIQVDPNQLRGLKEELTKMPTTAKQLVERYLTGGTAYKETTYTDFLTNNGAEINKAVSDLRKLKPILPKLSEEDYARIERAMSIYDTNVSERIQHWIMVGTDAHEIAVFAGENQDRFGTETRMVLFAIKDFVRAAGLESEEDDE
jgi:hypothetical protein